MDVPKLLILEVLGRIYSTRERNMDSRKDSDVLLLPFIYHVNNNNLTINYRGFIIFFDL